MGGGGVYGGGGGGGWGGGRGISLLMDDEMDCWFACLLVMM